MRSSIILTAVGALLLASVAEAQTTPPPASGQPPMQPTVDPATTPPVEATPAPPVDAAQPAAEAAPTGSPEGMQEADAVSATAYEPTMEAPPDAAPEQALTAEELEALGFGGTGGAAAVDTDLKIFGFADFSVGMRSMKASNQWSQFLGRHTSFYVGNFNLFLSKALSENVRTMAEVRFHYSPHGSSNAGDGTFNVSTANDHADFNRPIHWGGIEIERIYIEYSLIPNLTIRAGQFLTPYGIWNVDHGSPLFIPVQRPYVIGSQLFPERQTGFELFGRWDASQNNSIGYHLTLSNGFGPISEIRDLDDNKAVGGRLYWETRALGELRIGASAFYGKDTTTRTLQGLDASGALSLTESVVAQSKVLSFAGDVQWKYRRLHIQAEGITQQRKWADGGRFGAASPLLGGQTLYPIDYTTWGVYGLIGYRFEWMGVMPYFMPSRYKEVGLTNLLQDSLSFAMGLNIRPIDAVVLKLEYIVSKFPNGFLISDDNIHLIQAQVAWTF